MSPKELSESLGRLAEKATPGPWQSSRGTDDYADCIMVKGRPPVMGQRYPRVCKVYPAGYEDPMSRGQPHEANAILIVALRNNLPAIRAALDGMEAMSAYMRAREDDDDTPTTGMNVAMENYRRAATGASDAKP